MILLTPGSFLNIRRSGLVDHPVSAAHSTTVRLSHLAASSYRRRINAFVMANPKLGKEPVAVTLRRYKDQDVGTAPQK
jgi:hypothetical protein